MIYLIKNKGLKIIYKDSIIELPSDLQEKINKNFKSIKNSGANVWNGEVSCVTSYSIEDDYIEIICKKSDYAHYLYEEKVGCEKKYQCRNLSGGCLIETIDGYYIIGELDNSTSYPNMLQVPGGNIYKTDIINGKIDIIKTIIRETKEELNIDLNDEKIILNNKVSYLYISEPELQPGCQIFTKTNIKMTAEELKNHFENYNTYLKENNLEIEFKKLHFLKKENAIEELKKLNKPVRCYLEPLFQIDI